MACRRGKRGTDSRRRREQPQYAPQKSLTTGERFRVPPSLSMPKVVFVICHYCGYGPSGDVPDGGVCPKCGGQSWERFALAEPLVPKHMR